MSFNLAILCALEIEANPIINTFDMVERHGVFDERLGLRFFVASQHPKICLLLFGKCRRNNADRIGTQFAALSTWELIKTVNPKMIASVGTAGGFKSKGHAIGDIILSDGEICFHGRHIPVPQYQAYQYGNFPTLSLKTTEIIKPGKITSGDSIPVSPDDHAKMTALNTDAKDMEAAAVAEVAYMASVPMFALKSISDFVDSSEQTHQQFMRNFELATHNLACSLKELLRINEIN